MLLRGLGLWAKSRMFHSLETLGRRAVRDWSSAFRGRFREAFSSRNCISGLEEKLRKEIRISKRN